MMEKILARGAEAVVMIKDGRIVKERTKKSYRLKELDLRLRKERTRREAKILNCIPVPHPKLISSDDKKMTIEMEYIKGCRIADVLEKKDFIKISKEIGRKIKAMHEKNIIHGDLTTSNMILKEEVYFIDFGLSFFSDKTEDKAVDLHLMRQALESRHHTIWKRCFDEILGSYDNRQVIDRLKKVEIRGKNKAKNN